MNVKRQERETESQEAFITYGETEWLAFDGCSVGIAKATKRQVIQRGEWDKLYQYCNNKINYHNHYYCCSVINKIQKLEVQPSLCTVSLEWEKLGLGLRFAPVDVWHFTARANKQQT